MKILHPRSILLGAVALAVTSSVSLGQVRQIQTGNPMDANPAVGAGGSNRPIQGYVPVPVNGNDVVSGNVSGLQYFHGRTAAPSPYTFQGNQGSAALSNFARQSAGTPVNGTYTGLSQTYYLPSSTVSTGGGSLYSAPIGSGFDSGLVPANSINPAVSGPQLNAFTQNQAAVGGAGQSQAINRMVSPTPVEPGSPGAVLSNSLFVLRTTELPKPKDTDLSTPPGGFDVPITGTSGEGSTESKPGDLGGAASKPAVDPAMINGAVNSGVDSRVTSQTDELKDASVSDTYRKIAEELRANQGSNLNAAPGGGNATQPGNENKQNPYKFDLDPLTGKPRQIALLPKVAGTKPAGLGTTKQPGKVTEPTLSAKHLNDLTTEELTQGAKIKPVKLAPGTGSAGVASTYDMLMARGEKDLNLGKYLDAAESYQNALASKPDDPLALVGRSHAEMGAGIYTASEYDLKFVFTRKPELISIRYDAASFIPASRQDYLLEDLQKLAAKPETANMASFLYCYLCYETNRTTLLQAELDQWGKRDGHDEWQAVVSRAWMPKQTP